ncbi:hypothetical protein LB543_01215 [Mesorhizobium sp. ESP7-2]|uniref:hypothetical protein n=1 Tax=Mesorhizobium sp. ESP7-2 TaxID=2876622 RepID=UPI001CCDF3A3|nr:hypothetical protein [Mesorhizobium sp. ESP7-2]MBZ9705348.1 hypothetical protein [Mesorhizobium sp. ESP7-2]
MSAAVWSILLAVSVALAAAGTEYLDRPIFEGDHWSNDIAAAVMWSGRAGVVLALCAFVGGAVAA